MTQISSAPIVFESRGLHKHFGALHATNDVSIQLYAGEIHGLIGPNGAGKSTLIHQLAGTLRPDQGELFLNGKNITHLKAHERVAAGLARSFQVTNIFNHYTVLENLLLAVQAATGSSLRFWRARNSETELLDKAKQLAMECAIDRHLWSAQARHLPHGEQRKLEFALSLAASPSVMLLDEPMAGMGPDESLRLTELIESMRGKAAMLLVEHDMQAVFRLADRISVLVAGKIIASGTPDEIRHNQDVKNAYLGDEATEAA
ncbi:ABC transporter ATP-binding protein [Paenalcaligenes sp.]|uniref:ABC transporter ATP-binding protein n=1 Tax=Paenalcaligenes sp. TaxID=1966342 RepID=UPI00261F8DA9|nr:ABC transporter ATP-binding protein [Paenalcaligenes sp.]